jgi:tight adherence protein B
LARLSSYTAAEPASAIAAEPKQGPVTRGMDRLVANRKFVPNTQRALARANLKFTVSEYIMLHVITAIGGLFIVFLLSRNLTFAPLGAVVGLYLPSLYVRRRHSKRLAAFNAQLGDTLSLVTNSLRSGYSLFQSLDMVAREAPEPTKLEFSRVVREVSLGLSPEEALANLVRRIDSDDLDLIVTAINVQHEVGGNLAKILDTIGTTIRERVRIKGEIKVLTSQQLLSGYIISFLPIAIGLIIYLMNPGYIGQLFSTEQVICMPVIVLPICGAVAMILGFVVMRKIIAIDV